MAFVRFVMRRRRWLVAPLLGLRACVSAGGHRVCDRHVSLPKNVPGESTSHFDPVYGRVVSTLAGQPIKVYCWSQAGWATRLAERRALWPGADSLGPWRAYTELASLVVD